MCSLFYAAGNPKQHQFTIYNTAAATAASTMFVLTAPFFPHIIPNRFE